MRHPRLFVFAPLLLASVLALSAAVACGDDAASSGANNANNGSNNGSNNSTVPGDAFLLGDCDPSAAAPTCANGATCAAADADDLGVCLDLPAYYDTPNCGPMPHPIGVGELTPDCCTDADCTEAADGHCIFTHQQIGCCDVLFTTTCVYDGCQSDADCADVEICLPAGTRWLTANTCAPAPCLQDADCADAPGGECRLLGRDTFTALVCTYPDSPCQQDADCTSSDPCNITWCAPAWSSTDQGWVLGAGVVCERRNDCSEN